MAGLSIEVDTAGFAALLAFTDPKAYAKAARGALIYAGRGAKTRAAREIGARYGMKAARIKADIGDVKITGTGAEIMFKRKSPPTIHAYSGSFTTSGASSSSRGKTSWTIFKGERKTSTSIFWRRSRSGKFLPFISERDGGKGKYYNGIRVMYGPSIGSIFARKSRFGDAIRAETGAYMTQQWTEGIRRQLNKLSSRR